MDDRVGLMHVVLSVVDNHPTAKLPNCLPTCPVVLHWVRQAPTANQRRPLFTSGVIAPRGLCQIIIHHST